MMWPPRRGSREAPYFDGSKLEELLWFFEDIEMLAADFQKDAEWMCKQVTYYAATSCSSLWATVPELKKKGVHNWSIVKEEIRKLYPELINGQRYTRANITQLVNVQSEKEMTVQTEFGCYCCKFQVQAEYLKEQGNMSACKLDYKPVFTVGTINEAKDRSNASEGEKYEAVLGADLDAEVMRLEECLRDVKRQREEARTMKANTKPVKVRLKQSTELSKIIKQVLDQMMDSVVTLTHCELFAIALELECQYAAKLMRMTQMYDKMLNKARSGPAKAEEEETSEEARTDSRED
ncbi:uncharacterized protein FOMMEDRAFT_160710 [Fomitiporia mediterranea MF3/22]|uniref:uncharacterized protein n=1 Tax=Fomitiporia mediterranea (strain MF3/22) TaxID=694068 RepID=UPI0004409594|nr:uncharacterized protein FOMMEDRAFT_160710 [Fomitiporia mediterranea MF3/22]EJC99144.1 hypothetical protein FOMMEDRAFT_160710 [Fomitiporia mediterranea MF3/22]